ncbi:MAG: twin-arginine translocase subunit TatB [Alphaproteobacteria bacterium]|nr:twin-arginine translocase subunit TatB [Alphaproteobacteria bacterium]
MLPGVDFSEMLLIAIIAMVLLGPRDLPLMMRKIGRITGKMRAMAFEFRQGFDELGRQAELEELRKEVSELKKHTGLEELSKDFEEDRAALERDIAEGMSDRPKLDVADDASPLDVSEMTTSAASRAAADEEAGELLRIHGNPSDEAAASGDEDAGRSAPAEKQDASA